MNRSNRATSPGKIILTGEYAVVFGKRGIAVPSVESITVSWMDDASLSEPAIIWHDVRKEWTDYARQILDYMKPYTGDLRGTLTIESSLPLGKGMGSSTALVIAICRCMLGPQCEKEARDIEDQINPGHSGIDFAVIWKSAPLLYAQGKEAQSINLPKDILADAKLVDSGSPNETTKELVAWMRTREQEVAPAIAMIGDCTERLLRGESLHTVMRDHHRAQVALGIVPESAQKIIEEIERAGGSAKVIGAGGRTGGGGMVLALPSLSH